jgi:hypothetical protein
MAFASIDKASRFFPLLFNQLTLYMNAFSKGEKPIDISQCFPCHLLRRVVALRTIYGGESVSDNYTLIVSRNVNQNLKRVRVLEEAPWKKCPCKFFFKTSSF